MIDQYLFNCTNVLRKEAHTWTGVPQQTTEPRSRGWFICRRLTGKQRHLAWKMTSGTSLPGEHQLQPRGRQHPGPALSHDGILKEKDHKNWSLGSGNHALQRGEAGEAPALQRSAYPQVPSSQVAGGHPQRQPLSSRVDVFAPLKCHVNQERGPTGKESVIQPSASRGQSFSRGRCPGVAEGDTAFPKPQVLEAPLRRANCPLSCAHALLPGFLSISSSYFDVEFRVLPVHSRALLFISVVPCVTHLASTPSLSAAQGCRANTWGHRDLLLMKWGERRP